MNGVSLIGDSKPAVGGIVSVNGFPPLSVLSLWQTQKTDSSQPQQDAEVLWVQNKAK